MLVDTSGLLAAMFGDQRHHAECRRAVDAHSGGFLLSPFVLAELDYLIARLGGVGPELELLDEVARGAYQLAEIAPREIAQCRDVIEEYRDLELGLADASLVVLSRNSGCVDLLTLDERHFRAVRGPAGRAMRLHPADSPMPG